MTVSENKRTISTTQDYFPAKHESNPSVSGLAGGTILKSITLIT